MDVFIGRQPIFNIQEQIVAYELLYRNNKMNTFPETDSDTATVDVLVNSLLSIGLDEVTKGRPYFVNFTENLLLGPITDYLEPHNLVIEILEDIAITEEFVLKVKELKKRGFKIALDDFVMQDDLPIYDELFRYVDYIKVDFLLSPLLERMVIEDKVKMHFPHIKLLAEKVETRNQFEIAKHSGYTLFQGYFFEQPQILQSTDIPANVLQYFQVISLLKDEEPDIELLAENIERDIALTYKLLQLINYSTKRGKSKVRSIRQAILLLGLTELRKWVYLLAMRESGKQHSDVFKELMFASLFRAKVCESVARINYKENFSEYFLVGLFSLIDSLLGRPLPVILMQLPLSETVLETIAGKTTEMTPYLEFSIALNQVDFDKIDELSKQLHISKEQTGKLYDDAYDWVATALNV
ncbi:MAG: HDOD domain-containing protein [Solibacillus sp.]